MSDEPNAEESAEERAAHDSGENSAEKDGAEDTAGDSAKASAGDGAEESAAPDTDGDTDGNGDADGNGDPDTDGDTDEDESADAEEEPETEDGPDTQDGPETEEPEQRDTADEPADADDGTGDGDAETGNKAEESAAGSAPEADGSTEGPGESELEKSQPEKPEPVQSEPVKSEGTPAPDEPEPETETAETTPVASTPAPSTPAAPAAAASIQRDPADDRADDRAEGSAQVDTGPASGRPAAAPEPARRPRRSPWRVLLGTVMLVVVLGCGVLVAGYLLVGIPPANEAAAAQTNVYLYSDGSQLARDGEINRENIDLARIPRHVQEAVLAAEDREFYEESAVDPSAMIRAGWNMITGGGKQSGSTITQQYVKNYYLSQDQTLARKAKEFFIALKLGNEVSKGDILEGYLNTSYFGRNAYGIQAAAQSYYGKDVSDLTTAEGAYLAALVNSPNAYDTEAHPENHDRAVSRWHYVLDGMVKQGWLTESRADRFTFPKPQRAKPATGMSGQRGYLVEAVKNYLINNGIIDERRLAAGGFRITTTLQPKLQKAMREAVDERLMSKLDKDREVDSYVRAGGTSVDPKTGKIVAMYGGIDYTQQYVNNATRRDYQVGSTFKPFIFTSALQNRSTTQSGQEIGPNTVYDGTNKREVVNDGVGTGYKPANEDDKSYGSIPVTQAMNKSVNAVFAQMGVDVGPKKVKQTAIDLGLPEDTPNMTEDGSIALGVATASTTDMAEAYATLANHGKRGHYRLVEKATHGGEVIELPERETGQEIHRGAADATTAVLRKVVESGTGVAAKSAGRPAAGKTGTAEEDRAAWFAGYTPELATVVSVMGQNSETGEQKPLYGAGGVERVNGGGYPAEIWGEYTKAALEGRPVQDFDLQTGGRPDRPGTTPPDSDTPSTPSTGTPTQPSPTFPTDPPTDPGTPTLPPPTEPGPTDPTEPPSGGVDGGTVDGGDNGGTDNGTSNGPNGGWQGGNTSGSPVAARDENEDEYDAGGATGS